MSKRAWVPCVEFYVRDDVPVMPGVAPFIHDKIRARMKAVDDMPPAIRALVHEHGYSMIRAFLDCGVMRANQIKHLIRVVREGSYDGGRNPVAGDYGNGSQLPEARDRKKGWA